MAEQNKTQMGDGADNYGQAAGQMAKAAKQLGQEAAKQAAAKGVEATANAATAAVQASVEGGKAAAEIARWPLGCDSFCSLGYASHTV